MPIVDIQRRARELGRIRIGEFVAGPNGKGHPQKLDRFRITSQSEELIRKVARLYGGEPRPWTPQGGNAPGWEVVTQATRLPVLVPPQPVSQWYELWSGGGCQRRCDGVREVISDSPCCCSPDPEERECKPTTRLNVVLRDIEGVGVFRLESKGYYAASELPAVAEMLSHGARYLEAKLSLEERVIKRDGKTKRFIVPTFEVDITFGELMAGQGGSETPELPVASPAELESGDLWQQILAAVPSEWTTQQVEEDFYRRAGVRPDKATADQLRRHLTWLTSRRKQPANGKPAAERASAARSASTPSEREQTATGPTAEPKAQDGDAATVNDPTDDMTAAIEECKQRLDIDGARDLWHAAKAEDPGPTGRALRERIEAAMRYIRDTLEEQRQVTSDATAETDIAEMDAEELARLKNRRELEKELFALLGEGGITDSTAGRQARLTICSRLTVPNRVPAIGSSSELSDLEVAQVIVAMRRYRTEGTLAETLAAMSEVNA